MFSVVNLEQMVLYHFEMLNDVGGLSATDDGHHVRRLACSEPLLESHGVHQPPSTRQLERPSVRTQETRLERSLLGRKASF